MLSLVLAAVVCSGGTEARASHEVVAEPAPVASLEPAATAALWHRLVATRAHRAQATADCRPLRGMFYAATDFLRLATKLAVSASPCAEYYVSIPPIVGNKTQPRRDQAWRIRALSPNFHAMAEIHYGAWTDWVESTGSTWYEAGRTARARMAEAGYDVSAGDTWVINEATSAVRRGTGHARANLRELLRGLWEGDGTQLTRGAVFAIGVGQKTSDVSLYQTNLQSWLADSAFWADVSVYVSDWLQEVYGDVRNYAVAGVPTTDRRDYLNDYLQHELMLANAGPPAVDPARSYLQAAFSPLANAAWGHQTGYGWTMVPMEQMAGYVSAQVYALRHFSAAAGQAQDHWGFAWAPLNTMGATTNDFVNKGGFILDRLAQAIQDSDGTAGSADPGSAACGPPGQNLWCAGDVDGAALNPAWRSFRGWTQPALEFTTEPQTIAAGTPSTPMSLVLTTSSGTPATTPTPLAVTLSSGSPQGTFSTSPEGPWSPTLSLVIAPGQGTSEAFYYLETHAGSTVITGSAEDVMSATQTEAVIPGPAASLTVAPTLMTLRAGGSRRLVAESVDAYGNAVPVPATWSVLPATMGMVAPTTGSTTTFTAARRTGQATVTATLVTANGTLSASATVHVGPRAP